VECLCNGWFCFLWVFCGLSCLGHPIVATAAPSAPLLNQLQNYSFEQIGWSPMVWRSTAGADCPRRSGYGESDGKIDHWEVPTAWRDASVAHTGTYSVKLTGARSCSRRFVWPCGRLRAGTGNGNQTDEKPIDAGDLAKLEKRVVTGGAGSRRTACRREGEDRHHGRGKAEVTIPGGTYDWKWVEIGSRNPGHPRYRWASGSNMPKGRGGDLGR